MFNLALWWSTWGHQIHLTGETSYSSLLLKAGLTYSRLLRALFRLVLDTSKDRGGTASLGPCSLWNIFLPYAGLVSLAATCDHCLVLSLWPWAEGLWGPSWGCSPTGLAMSTGYSTVGQLWRYIWKCPILLLSNKCARSPLLMRATTLGTLFMLLSTDWLQQWSNTSK